MESKNRKTRLAIPQFEWEKIIDEYLCERERNYISVKDWLIDFNRRTGLDVRTNTMIINLRKPQFISRYLRMDVHQ